MFASKSGRPLGHRGATGRGFDDPAKEARLEDVSFHSMRHAFASRMIDRGISSTVLARLMGHESSAITERRCIHLFDKQRTDDAVRQAMPRWASWRKQSANVLFSRANTSWTSYGKGSAML